MRAREKGLVEELNLWPTNKSEPLHLIRRANVHTRPTEVSEGTQTGAERTDEWAREGKAFSVAHENPAASSQRTNNNKQARPGLSGVCDTLWRHSRLPTCDFATRPRRPLDLPAMVTV